MFEVYSSSLHKIENGENIENVNEKETLNSNSFNPKLVKICT